MRTGQGLQCGLHSHLLDVGHRSPCGHASVIREGSKDSCRLKPTSHDLPISAMFSSVRYCRSLGAASLQSTQLLVS